MTPSRTLSQIHGLRNSRGGVLRSIIKEENSPGDFGT